MDYVGSRPITQPNQSMGVEETIYVVVQLNWTEFSKQCPILMVSLGEGFN